MRATPSHHPCFFAPARGRYGRIHLPVAPGCNISCAYCRRDYDCVNESRPGVTSRVMSPEEALDHLERSLAQMPYLSVVGIAGPGDPFHNPGPTLQCLEMVRQKHPELNLCVSSNGYNLAPWVGELAAIGVGFVTVTMNALDPQAGAGVYSRVGPGPGALSGPEGARVLIARQLEALARLQETAITVKVNTVLAPGVNQNQVEPIAARAAALGVSLMNLIPLIPVTGTPLANLAPPHPALLQKLRALAGRHLAQMTHCQRCRADAAGLLGQCRQAAREPADPPAKFSGCSG